MVSRRQGHGQGLPPAAFGEGRKRRGRMAACPQKGFPRGWTLGRVRAGAAVLTVLENADILGCALGEVVGRHGEGKGGAVTLAGRKGGPACGWVVHSRQAPGTRGAILEALKDKPVKGMPLDNGPGFAEFQKLEGQPNAPIFFAEPHKPWQRGCSGNAHGLLRYFFPRGCNFLDVSQTGLGHALGLICHRPRKRLNWRTPFHVFFETVALA